MIQRISGSIISLILVFTVTVQGQPQVNVKLQKELDSMYMLDQRYRELLTSDMTVKADSLATVFQVKKEGLIDYLWKIQLQIDSSNLVRVEEIIKKHGYPGKTLVGTPANEAVFYVIQHSPVIDKYLPLIKQVAEQGELPFRLYAMMLDRSLMYQGKEQIYGTQGKGFQIINPQTKQNEMKMIIWPIKDAATVNERRKAAGFDQTVEENAKRLGINYQPLTIADFYKLRGF